MRGVRLDRENFEKFEVYREIFEVLVATFELPAVDRNVSAMLGLDRETFEMALVQD